MRFSTVRVGFLGLTSLALTGCASLIDSNLQSVTVYATCEGRQIANVACNLQNDKGRWVVRTPGSVVVQKSYGDLTAVCRAPDLKTSAAAFQSSATRPVYANVLNGGVIGWVVDSSLGAGFDYPQSLVVEFPSPCGR